MAPGVRITSDCDGLSTPYHGGPQLYRFGRGSELPLLRDDDRDFYKVAYDGQPIFVAKSCGVRIEDVAIGDPLFVPPTTPAFVAITSEASAILAPSAAVGAALGRLEPYQPVERVRQPGWLSTTLRGLGLIGALVSLASGSGLVITAGLQGASTNNNAVASVGITGAVAVLFGFVLVYVCHRPLLEFAVALGGVAFVLGGCWLLIAWIPLSEMRPGDFDPDKARTALLLAAAVLVPLGFVMLAPLVIRLRDPTRRAQLPELARRVAVSYGGLLLLAGGFGGPIFAATHHASPTVREAAAIGAVVPLLLVPGAILTISGLQTFSGTQFRLPSAATLLLVFGASVLLGALVVTVKEPIVWLMLVAHATAALVPALALIAFASRANLGWSSSVEGLSWRRVCLAFALGISAITVVAATFDGLMAQGLSTAVLASSGAFHGLRYASDLARVFQYPDRYLSKGQTIFLMLMVAAVLAPIMEEGFKGLGVVLVLPRRATPSVALALGVAVGAGFGVTEATLYGAASLQHNSNIDWWSLMLLRGGATSMHALNTGLLGLALYRGQSGSGLRRVFPLYLAAVATHGLWNTLSVLAGSRVIFSFSSLTDRQLAMLAFAVLAPLAIATLAGLRYVAHRAHQASAEVGEATADARIQFAVP